MFDSSFNSMTRASIELAQKLGFEIGQNPSIENLNKLIKMAFSKEKSQILL